jgi:ABC-type Fe3+ transport system permease subunit
VTYVKAVIVALLAAVALGAATGAWRVLVLAVERLRPEDRQVVLSQSISEAMNCAAFYAMLMIPLGLIVAYVVRRRRQRLKSQPD